MGWFIILFTAAAYEYAFSLDIDNTVRNNIPGALFGLSLSIISCQTESVVGPAGDPGVALPLAEEIHGSINMQLSILEELSGTHRASQ